jgi:glycine oxidase
MGLKIVVVGGGIVGCMTALTLAQRGHQITVVERNIIAAQTSGEASWAGAGLLFPLLPWMYKEEVNQLSLKGAALYPKVCQQLLQETGIDPEYIQSGMLIQQPYDKALALNWCEKNQISIEQHAENLFLPKVGQVRNPKLMQALKLSLIQRGVHLLENTELVPIAETNEINAWLTTDGLYLEADKYVVTSGAWSFELLKETASTLNIKPMRGQILLYKTPVDSLSHIVYKNGFYLVPRKDGFLLAGSTLEDVGFDTGVTETVKQELQGKAEAIMPSLQHAPIVKHWSGLRPGTPENLPTIAVHPTIKNLYLNTGHFRYGLTMAPACAQMIAQLIEDC